MKLKPWFAAAVLAVFSVVHVSAENVPNVVEFSTPTAGVTGIVLGDGEKYNLYMEIQGLVGPMPESDPMPSNSRLVAADVSTPYSAPTPSTNRKFYMWWLCSKTTSSCKRAIGLSLLQDATSMQLVQLVDNADRQTLVGYNGNLMTFCHATNYTTENDQGFACSQIPWSTTAKPYAVRGISSNNTDFYGIVFGAPSATAASSGDFQPLVDEMNRNLDFENTIRSSAASAAQAAGVPLSRVQPLCQFGADPVGAINSAHALRVVPLCAGRGGYDFLPQPTPVSSTIELPPVTVIGSRPSPIYTVVLPSVGSPVSGTTFEDASGSPVPPSGGANSPNVHTPTDPKNLQQQCQNEANQRQRVNNAMCSAAALQASVGATVTGTVTAVGLFIATKNGKIAVGVGAAVTAGLNQLSNNLGQTCQVLINNVFAEESAACSATTY